MTETSKMNGAFSDGSVFNLDNSMSGIPRRWGRAEQLWPQWGSEAAKNSWVGGRLRGVFSRRDRLYPL